jgi:hypothetical protein
MLDTEFNTHDKNFPQSDGEQVGQEEEEKNDTVQDTRDFNNIQIDLTQQETPKEDTESMVDTEAAAREMETEQKENRNRVEDLLKRYPEVFERVVLEDDSIAAFKAPHIDRGLISHEPITAMLFTENGRLDFLPRNRRNIEYSSEELTQLFNNSKEEKTKVAPLSPSYGNQITTEWGEYMMNISDQTYMTPNREKNFYYVLDRAREIAIAKNIEEKMRPERERNNLTIMQAVSENLKKIAKKVELPNGETVVLIPQTNDIKGEPLTSALILTKGCYIVATQDKDWGGTLKYPSLTAVAEMINGANKQKAEGWEDKYGKVNGQVNVQEGNDKKVEYKYTRMNSIFGDMGDSEIRNLISELKKLEETIPAEARRGEELAEQIATDRKKTQDIVNLFKEA